MSSFWKGGVREKRERMTEGDSNFRRLFQFSFLFNAISLMISASAWLLFWKLPLGAPPPSAGLSIKCRPELQNILAEDLETAQDLPQLVHRYHEGVRSCPCCHPCRCCLLRSCICLPICLRHHALLLCLHLPRTAPCPPPGVFLHQQQVLPASSCLYHPEKSPGVCQPRQEMGEGVHQLFGDELGWRAP